MRVADDRPRLTDRQQAIVDFIRSHSEQQGYPPSVREIGDHFGIVSPNGVMCHLRALERKGYLTREHCTARGIRLLDDLTPLELPLLGRVPAGYPSPAFECEEAWHLGHLTQHGQFGIRVDGWSMQGAGINDGDIAVIRESNDVYEGQIVAALVDGEVTLKRFYRESGTVVRLEPDNPEFAPIYAENVRILGVMAGLVRKY